MRTVSSVMAKIVRAITILSDKHMMHLHSACAAVNAADYLVIYGDAAMPADIDYAITIFSHF